MLAGGVEQRSSGGDEAKSTRKEAMGVRRLSLYLFVTSLQGSGCVCAYLGVPLDDSRKEGKGNGERCGRTRALPLGSATYHDIVQPFGGHVPNRSKTSERKTMRSTRAIVPDVTVRVKL